jgi:hypothetical protein
MRKLPQSLTTFAAPTSLPIDDVAQGGEQRGGGLAAFLLAAQHPGGLALGNSCICARYRMKVNELFREKNMRHATVWHE